MKSRWIRPVISAVAAAVALQGTAVRAQSYRPPQTVDGKPDLHGIWQALSTAAYDLQDHGARAGILLENGKPFPMALGIPAGKGVVEGNDIPYQPWAAAKKKENFALGLAADPIGKCYMPGVPRATYLPFPFEIFQTPKYVAMLYEYSHTYRIIYTDGSPHVEGLDFWMGDSRGRWEGNALVVDVTRFNDETWLDMAGNFHSDALHVIERYTLIDPNTIRYEATIEDPKVFTRPWKMSMLLHRRRDLNRILEYECADLAEEAAGTFVDLPETPRTRR